MAATDTSCGRRSRNGSWTRSCASATIAAPKVPARNRANALAR